MASTALQTFKDKLHALSKDELVKLAARGKAVGIQTAEKLKKPARQGTHTVFGWVGGGLSGVIRAFLPTAFGLQVDGWVGLLISAFSLLKAGDIWVDSLATLGVGMTAPAISRTTEGALRHWFSKPATTTATA